MGDVHALPPRVAPNSRFAAEHHMGGVAGFAVVYGPVRRDDPLSRSDEPTWIVAIRTTGQPDNVIVDCTYDPAKGAFGDVEKTIRDFAAVTLQALMHAAAHPPFLHDHRDGRA